MAFANAYLTEEEKRMFEEAKIRDPRYKIAKEYLKPNKWTIDRENNIALIYCGVADREEHNIKTFALVYKHIDEEHLVGFELMQKYTDDREALEQKYNVTLVKIWEIHNIRISKALENKIDINYIYGIIEDALTVYGVNGKPNLGYEPSIKSFLVHKK